eukprot:m.254457 g.254457  ORF g.254457 m.254457 type:complete len:2135 (+) comp15493_c9_seq1:187-6591(+)
MAEQQMRDKQYEYNTNANLVITADRRLIDSVSRDGATGEVKSLRGHLGRVRMGDRASRAAAPELVERKKKRDERLQKKAKTSVQRPSQLSDTTRLGLKYQPKTADTQAIYERILTVITEYLGSQPQDILMGAADEIIMVLKDESVKTKDKRQELSSLLGTRLSEEQFTQLVGLGNKISDYQDESAEQEAETVNEDHGVAIFFDGEDDEQMDLGQDEDDDLDEVRDEEEQDEEEGEVLKANLVQDGDAADENVVSVQEIDAFWLQRKLADTTSDAVEAHKLSEESIKILQDAQDDRDLENRLISLLEFQRFNLVKLLCQNRNIVLYATLRARASEEERKRLDADMASNPELAPILRALKSGAEDKEEQKKGKASSRKGKLDEDLDLANVAEARRAKKFVNLEDMAFPQGSHLMANKSCTLPEGAFRNTQKGYEEVHVPALKPKPFADGEQLVKIASLPEWAQPAFAGFTSLNRVQSRLYKTAFQSDENLLLCAPTGAGKTNVALLTILREIGNHRKEDGTIDLKTFKIVYIAPMKSLVAEMTGSFAKRLAPFNLRVEELTGDQSLTREQIFNTQVIVCTPEKWDVITRKGGYEGLVGLVIIDEIHLLHDGRGPVLEAIIARSVRQVERTQEPLRLVGLSATLPNFEDVSALLRVDPSSGLYFFDNSFRPCPLQQQYIGITERKAFKRLQMMNDIVYDKVMASAGKNQILIFTHSRKDTAQTARMLVDMCIEKDTLGSFMREDSASAEILRDSAGETKNKDLEELLPYGFACHHAGMSRADRTLVEDLFADRHIQVLVSTATLAWGVNLPAHTVIIKGTQVYSPETGGWTELSPLDVLQMLGRAGRPQFDKFGEGILITTHKELQYYLSLLNEQLPVESQLMGQLADSLNAEVVAGTVQNVSEGIEWLSYTYLYIRMLRNPTLYGISHDELENDRKLESVRASLIHSAALILDKANLMKYDKKSGNFQVTDLGRIASHYYCDHATIARYDSLLKPTMTEIEILRTFSGSSEFKYLRVREEEKLELQTLMEKVPIPIKESLEEPSAKINALLQAYISKLRLDGFALMSDMVYVTQSAGRLLRAIFEITMKRGWSQLADRVLNMCKMVDRRMWSTLSPLRQFPAISYQVVRSLEKKNIPWFQLTQLSHEKIGELIRQPKLGKTLHKYIHLLPKLELSSYVQPITRTTLKIMLTIVPDFPWDEKVHGALQTFWVIVEDGDSEVMLHTEMFLLRQRFAELEHHLEFFVPITDPMPPQYFIRVVSDRWIGSETTLPVSFRHLMLPEKFPPHTDLLDMQQLPVTSLKNKAFERMFISRFKYFNSIQTQTFNALFSTDKSVFVGAPAGSGKTVCAELAILRALSNNAQAKCVYIAPKQAICNQVLNEWRESFNKQLGLPVVCLTGEASADLKLLGGANIVIATPEQWDVLSRRWKQRRQVQNVALFIADETHLIGSENGPVLEVICSRMRYMASQLEKHVRMVLLSASVANAREIGSWCGVTKDHVFNFHPQVRPVPLEVFIQGFNASHATTRLMSMARPVFNAIKKHSPVKPAMVFVPSKKQAQVTATDIYAFASADSSDIKFLRASEDDVADLLAKVRDEELRETLQNGIGYLHEALHEDDRKLVEHLYTSGAIQVVVVSRELAWGLSLQANLVVIQDTQCFDGKDHRYVDYPMADVLQMMGRANRPLVDASCTCVLMCQSAKKGIFKKFLYEPLPVESHLDHCLHDHFNSEIVTQVIERKQDAVDYLTWTFLYRRMTQNPNYYNLHGVSHRHLSDHLSELVETTLADLEESKCIAVDDEDDEVSPLNLGMIAGYYYIDYTTIELFSRSLTDSTKLRGLLEIICSATEFKKIPVRYREDRVLKALATQVPIPQRANAMYNDPHVKVNLLLQAHFSRIKLSPELQHDQAQVLKMVLRLVQACVDVLSSSSWLKPAVVALELCQMIVQATWSTDSYLRQLPHVTAAMIKAAEEAGVESVADIPEMEDDVRSKVFPFSSQQMRDVAAYCNRYPSIDVEFQVRDEENVHAGAPTSVLVSLTRDDLEEGEAIGPVIAPYYPQRKEEVWWCIIGDANNALLGIKRVSLQGESTLKLDIVPPTEGTHSFDLTVICDSYAGCDQEYSFELKVKEALEGSSSEEEDEDSD